MICKNNPVTKKELISSSRTIRVPLLILVLDVITLILCLIALDFFNSESMNSSHYYGFYVLPTATWLGEQGRQLKVMLQTLLIIQFCIVFVMMPILCGSSIAEERQQQTFEMLITTGYSRIKIIIGKVVAGMSIIGGYVFSILPFVVVLQVVYSFSFCGIILVCFSMLLTGLLCASVGMCAGAKCSGTKVASVSGIAWLAAIIIGSILLIVGEYGIKALIVNWDYYTIDNMNILKNDIRVGLTKYLLVINPVFYAAQAINYACDGGNVMTHLQNEYSYVISFPKWFINNWFMISTICQILMSMFFLWWASVRINPLRKIGKYKKAVGDYNS